MGNIKKSKNLNFISKKLNGEIYEQIQFLEVLINKRVFLLENKKYERTSGRFPDDIFKWEWDYNSFVHFPETANKRDYTIYIDSGSDSDTIYMEISRNSNGRIVI
jgi:hypothetical protein